MKKGLDGMFRCRQSFIKSVSLETHKKRPFGKYYKNTYGKTDKIFHLEMILISIILNDYNLIIIYCKGLLSGSFNARHLIS